MLLVGVLGDNHSALTADKDSSIEMNLELELEGEEEVKMEWFVEKSLGEMIVPSTFLGPKHKWITLFFSSLDQKAAENPPEHQA